MSLRHRGVAAVNGVGAIFKGPRERTERLVEDAAQEGAKQDRAELIVDKEIDVRCVFAAVFESPSIVEVAEWAIDVADRDKPLSAVEGDACGECFAKGLVTDGHAGLQVLALREWGALCYDEVLAERHKLRIAFDIGDQSKHVVGAVRDQASGLEFRQGYVSLVEVSAPLTL